MNIRKKISIFMDIVGGLHKSIYVCFKYLPLDKAIKLPILISSHCSIIELGGRIELLAEETKPGMILFGIGTVGFIDRRYKRSVLELGKDSQIVFCGKARFGNGMKLSTNGSLTIGDNVIITGDSLILCQRSITIGKDSLISWNVEIMDSDMHRIFVDNEWVNKEREIVIGEHVWIASGCKILKGAKIANNTVIAANSLITKETIIENAIIGMNGKCMKKNITWER